MYGYDTALDARFDQIEAAMDLAGDGNALTMLINYAGYNTELFDWLEREYDIDTESYDEEGLITI